MEIHDTGADSDAHQTCSLKMPQFFSRRSLRSMPSLRGKAPSITTASAPVNAVCNGRALSEAAVCGHGHRFPGPPTAGQRCFAAKQIMIDCEQRETRLHVCQVWM